MSAASARGVTRARRETLSGYRQLFGAWMPRPALPVISFVSALTQEEPRGAGLGKPGAAPLGISLGDPTGVGPEVVVRALGSATRPVIVFGDEGVIARAMKLTGVRLPACVVVRGITRLSLDTVTPGRPNDEAGRAQVDYVAAATSAALAGDIAALVTAPISKEWAARAGFHFPGHTEYLAQRAGVTEFAMMLAGPQLRVTVVTTHLALRDVAAALSVERIASAITLTAQTLARDFAIPLPRVAVAGFNPHAGEAGRFGDEETRLITPAIALAEKRLASSGSRSGVAARISGPHVADAVFRQAHLGEFDAVVAMYHDQGLIPIKLVHFEDAVNVTLGLPFVRTSPDHGTAYDIAGTGQARPTSFAAALKLAEDLAEKKQRRADLDRPND